MYTKQEASLLRQEFWTAFGKYMTPVLSAEGEKTNWINYKTGIKGIAFKMQAEGNTAAMAIELTHTDPALQESFFNIFLQFKNPLTETLGEDWYWQLHTSNEHGKIISRIFIELFNANILNKAHWPQLISFFKPRIIALDQFWSEFKFAFE